MGHIAWKALPLVEKLDLVERRLDEMEPLVAEALAAVRLAQQGRNLPQYLTQRLHGLDYDLCYAIQKLRNRVDSIREDIPADAIERERSAVPQAELEL